MHHETIPFRDTGFFSQLNIDYIDRSPKLAPFYTYSPDLDGLKQSMEDLSKLEIDRETLVSELRSDYSRNGIDRELSSALIDKFKAESTFAVVTAHQPCLFTGPLYFIIKIAATINLARRLELEFPDKDFIPVYWLGGEDHDFEEISIAHVYNKDLNWVNEKASGPVGRLPIEGLKESIEHLSEILGSDEKAQSLISKISNAYLNSNTYGEATFKLVDEIFGEEGLVIVSADNKAFKANYSDVIREELFGTASGDLIKDQMEALENEYHNQAFARQVNLFYMEDGRRERIERDGEDFLLVDSKTKLSSSEMEDLIENRPEVFSPNVILRPAYQQRTLPAIAFIGGGSEIAYWMQLKPIFQKFKIHFPALFLRNSALFIDANSEKKMAQTNIDIPDLFTDTEALKKEFVQKNSGDEVNLGFAKAEINKLFGSIQEQGQSIDPSLKGSISAELQKAMKSIGVLEGKFIRAGKKKLEVDTNKIQAVKDKLFPKGKLQERYDNFIPIYLRTNGEIIQHFISALDPLEPGLVVFVED